MPLRYSLRLCLWVVGGMSGDGDGGGGSNIGGGDSVPYQPKRNTRSARPRPIRAKKWRKYKSIANGTRGNVIIINESWFNSGSDDEELSSAILWSRENKR